MLLNLHVCHSLERILAEAYKNLTYWHWISPLKAAMPSLSFKGASGFTISGGNFSDVKGNVVTYNFGQQAGQQQLDQLPLPPDPDPVPAIAAPTSRSERSERRRQRRAARESIQQAPPSPSVASDGRFSTWATPAGPTNHSPASTSSTLSTDFDFDDNRHSRTSRYSTPPSDVEDLGPSEPTPNHHQNNLELLTPLTDSLNLRRFTPSTHSQNLSPVFETAPALSPEVRLITSGRTQLYF